MFEVLWNLPKTGYAVASVNTQGLVAFQCLLWLAELSNAREHASQQLSTYQLSCTAPKFDTSLLNVLFSHIVLCMCICSCMYVLVHAHTCRWVNIHVSMKAT